MFNGVPSVTLASPLPAVDYNKEVSDSRGCVLALDMEPVSRVVLDVSTALAIAKHARSGTTAHGVRGNICGLQLGSVVEVSMALPELVSFTDMRRLQEARLVDEHEKQRLEREKEEVRVKLGHEEAYKAAMTRERFDTYVVGHYIGAGLCSHSLRDMEGALRSLFDKALSVSPAVLLIYDPVRTGVLGKLAISAYTFTSEFLTLAKGKSEKRDLGGVWNMFLGGERLVKDFATFGVTQSGMLREVPVEIRASALVKSALHVMEEPPLPCTNAVAVSPLADQYLEELLAKTQQNCDALRQAIGKTKWDDSKERVVTDECRAQELVLIDYIKKQTAQLVGLCDAVLLNAVAIDSI